MIDDRRRGRRTVTPVDLDRVRVRQTRVDEAAGQHRLAVLVDRRLGEDERRHRRSDVVDFDRGARLPFPTVVIEDGGADRIRVGRRAGRVVVGVSVRDAEGAQHRIHRRDRGR